MQTQKELEEWYSKEDPWEYKTNDDDRRRLKQILFTLGWGPRVYSRALDVGCGEGFVTTHLPAFEIHGMDISLTAMSRLPSNVKAVTKPEGKYDLVISTGTLYKQYDHEFIYKTIMEAASRYILIAGIEEWLVPYDFGRRLYHNAIQYRQQYNQLFTLYELEAGA